MIKTLFKNFQCDYIDSTVAAITPLSLTKQKFRRFQKPIMMGPAIKESHANRFALPGKACGYSFDHASTGTQCRNVTQ